MTRQRLPDRRASERFDFTHGGQSYSATVSRFDDGHLGEIFIDAAKPGSAIAEHANDSAVLASLLLQNGVDAGAIVHSIAGPIRAALMIAEDR
jgi:ribonucleoside-diphosphate reductase alpha chain